MTNRIPYVGEGEDGARRSAQIDRDEASTLALDDPRLQRVLESAIRWDEQAAAACRDCKGTGERVLNPSWPSGAEPYSEKCPTCSGTGQQSV